MLLFEEQKNGHIICLKVKKEMLICYEAIVNAKDRTATVDDSTVATSH